MKTLATRRSVLKALGAAGAFVPLLEADLARAATTPKRLVVLAWTNGFSMKDFWPGGGETDFTLGQTLSPLEPFRKDLLFVGGVGLRAQLDANSGYGGHHHAYPALLTGVPLAAYNGAGGGYAEAGAESVDQYVARELARRTPLLYSSLVASSHWSGGIGGLQTNMSYRGPGTGINPEVEPLAVYKKLFGARLLGKDDLRRLLLEKRSVLDFVGGALESAAKRLGGEDRARIASHLDAVRAMEGRLALLETPATACALPDAPPDKLYRGHGPIDFDQINTYPPLIGSHLDMIVAALRCDLTRVSTMVLTDYGGDFLVYPWLGSEFLRAGSERAKREFHDITHTQDYNDQNRADKIRVDQWYFQQVAYLVQRLKSIPEGAGTMLDNTAVVVTNTMGYNHNSNTVPFIILGSCGGYFKTGRFLRVGSAVGRDGPPSPSTKGAPHNGVLVALANAMGVDGTRFGLPRLAQELPGLRA